MKKLFLVILSIFFSMGYVFSQSAEYQTFVYTSSTLSSEIRNENDRLLELADMQEQNESNLTRGSFGSDLLAATLDAGKGLASGYITSFIDLGINAIASLATRNSRLKAEWEEIVKNENVWSTPITNVDELKDFYSTISKDGALDPMGMRFDGIGCLKKEDGDTVFFISCHIDRSKLYRIINHSKFELILDTLIINPKRSNLPNTVLPIEFSFKERKNFLLSVNIKLFSSWYTELIELHSNEQLGEFTIEIPVSETDLDDDGYLRYVRKENEEPKYKVAGESFIVPRSYTGYRDEAGIYRRIWGTGQYNLSMELKETCDITDEYAAGWKKDYKKRKKLQPKEKFLTNVWQTVTSQKWDEIGQKWIITTLSAPADVAADKLIEVMNLSTEKKPSPDSHDK